MINVPNCVKLYKEYLMTIKEKLKEVLKLMGLLKDTVIHTYYARKQKSNF